MRRLIGRNARRQTCDATERTESARQLWGDFAEIAASQLRQQAANSQYVRLQPDSGLMNLPECGETGLLQK